MDLFFFKQKTAYEMRISDWSSDVCSSDLARSSRQRPRAVPPRSDRVPPAEGAHQAPRRAAIPIGSGARDRASPDASPDREAVMRDKSVRAKDLAAAPDKHSRH